MKKANKIVFPDYYVTITRPTYTDRGGEKKDAIKVVYDDKVEYIAPLFDMQGE